jgi:hypothetical protein
MVEILTTKRENASSTGILPVCIRRFSWEVAFHRVTVAGRRVEESFASDDAKPSDLFAQDTSTASGMP